jgi:putative transposase
MTHRPDCTLPAEILEQIAEQGLDVLPELIRIVVNTAMQAERQAYLGVQPYERSPQRRDHGNGFKPKTVATRMGQITFDVPQVRKGNFYPSALERGIRSERALKLALAEMYVQGVSTRKVAAITEQLCGLEVSSTQVSQAAALLDEQLQAWRERPLGRCPYLYLDAHYEKVRQTGQVCDAAVLKAIGVNAEGRREVLGVSVSLSEHEVHWRTFLGDLVARGVTGVQLIISDAHAGLQGSSEGHLRCSAMATVSVPSAAECAGLRASHTPTNAGGSRHSQCLQRTKFRRGQTALEATDRQIYRLCTQARFVGRRELA